MTSPIPERVELAKICSSRDWSKAIRVLDSLLSKSFSVQDICNRAFCYSQLELHKHVVKDCDKAIQIEPSLLQAYILKGRALSALGKRVDALAVWQKGHEYALNQSADLKQLLELEELLNSEIQDKTSACNDDVENSSSSISLQEMVVQGSDNSSEAFWNKSSFTDKLNHANELNGTSDLCSMADPDLKMCNQVNGKVEQNCCVNGSIKVSKEPDCKIKSDESSFTDSGSIITESNSSSRADSRSIITESSSSSRADSRSIITEGSSSSSADSGSIITEGSSSSRADSGSIITESSSSSRAESGAIITESSSSSRTESSSTSAEEISSQNGRNDGDKTRKKFCVARLSKNKSISVDFRLSRGIAQVNEGKYAQAISIFDQILREDPTYPEALIGRGTAYAFKRELDAAIADFSKAIESNPLAGEAWKRRGQARAALGESAEAIVDLTRALEFESDSADILHERGIVNFKFKDFNAAVEDLSACLDLDRTNKSAYTYLGLALCSIGEYQRAEDAHKKAIELDMNFLEAWAHLCQFYHELARPAKAMECLKQVIQIDSGYAKAYHLRGLLLHGMGDHRNAIKELSAGLSIEKNIECLYLRASCYHAVGEYTEAAKDYDAALDLELDSMDKFVLQCLAFYQKEIALYTASKISSEFCWFDIDGDIHPLFKEYWCKRLHPKAVCEKVYRQPPLRDSLRKNKIKKLDFTLTKQKIALLQAADSIGKKIQYDCPGFLPNRRQHRMAGLAAIEIAQKVSKAWRTEWKNSNKSTPKSGKRARRRERTNVSSQNRGGAGCSTSSSAETSTSYGTMEDRSSGRSTLSWQDIYSIAVRWRQISEPCDPVVWVNKLSEEFNAGFGSHTPLILGQAKVVRYYPNYERTLSVAKAVIKEKLYVHDKADKRVDLAGDGKLQEIMNAKSCNDLHRIVGDDFWLATWCNSTAEEGKQLEGTRITLVKTGERAYDFAIRTPCTPARWDEFDEEMRVAWENICNAYCGETYGSTDFDMLENVRHSILKMTYYWYNFMPLSRGTAAVGFVVLLGLLLAANMEFTGSIPKGMQVDWEAILTCDPDTFVDSIKSWLYPSLKVTTSWKEFPDVASTLSTTGSVVAALSHYEQ